MGLLLLVIVILFLVSGLPHWGYHSYGYGPLGYRRGIGDYLRRAAPHRPTLKGLDWPWPAGRWGTEQRKEEAYARNICTITSHYTLKAKETPHTRHIVATV